MRKEYPKNSEKTGEKLTKLSEEMHSKPNFHRTMRKLYRKNSEETAINSDNREREDNKADDNSETNLHTHSEKWKGVKGENQIENDRAALAMFNRSWNELAKHERMYIWVRRHYPIMLEFERPLTLDNCRSITDRITDWHDVERLMESIANRRNVLTAHTSAIATFNSFARMDVVLQRKQKI